jgi:hypothetical protein
MYEFILTLHSWLRWAVLLLGILAISGSYKGWKLALPYTGMNAKINKWFISSLHTQLVLGLLLYFGMSPMMKGILADFGGSMKVAELRFWSVEHLMGMIIGIAIAQIGSIKAKRQPTDALKYKTAYVWFTVGLLIILLMIPFGIWNVERPLFRM